MDYYGQTIGNTFNEMKKLITYLLSIMLIISTMPVFAFAVESTEEDSNSGQIENESAVNYVAQVESGKSVEKFETLAEAVKAVKSGETIRLLDSCTEEGFSFAADRQNVTVDLDGKTFTCNGPSTYTKRHNGNIVIQGNDNITFKDGVIKFITATDSIKYGFRQYGDITFDNVNLDATQDVNCESIISNDQGDVKFTGTTSVYANGNIVSMENKFSSASYGSLVVDTDGYLFGDIAYVIREKGALSTVEVDNCTWAGKYNISVDKSVKADAEKEAALIKQAKAQTIFKGGIFTFDPTEYTDEGYWVADLGETDLNIEDGVDLYPTFKIYSKTLQNVAIGTDCYSSLDEAIAKAKDGDKLVMLNDVTITDQLRLNKSIELDLAGHIIKGRYISRHTLSSIFNIVNDSDMIISDSKEGGRIEGYQRVIYDNSGKGTATITVNGGTLSAGNGGSISTGTAAIWAGDTNVVVDGGSIEGKEYGVQLLASDAAELTLKNGTISAPNGIAVSAGQKTKVSMTGGEILNSVKGVVLDSASEFGLSGGAISTSGNCIDMATETVYMAKISVSGGKIMSDNTGININSNSSHGINELNVTDGEIVAKNAINIVSGTAVLGVEDAEENIGPNFIATGDTFILNENVGHVVETLNLSVLGGTYKTTGKDSVIFNITGKDKTHFVTDGAFSHEIPEKYLIDGNVCIKKYIADIYRVLPWRKALKSQDDELKELFSKFTSASTELNTTKRQSEKLDAELSLYKKTPNAKVSVSGKYATVTWNSETGVKTYVNDKLMSGSSYKYNVGFGKTTTVSVVQKKTTSYKDTVSGKTYTVTAKTPAATVGKPTVSNVAKHKLNISWKAASGAETYQVSISTKSATTKTVVSKLTKKSYSTTAVTKGKTYYVKVRAIAPNGVAGEWSTAKSIKISK